MLNITNQKFLFKQIINKRFSIFISIFIFWNLGYSLELTQKLSESQQKAMTESLGFGLAPFYAENLYPLGGYPGFRVSLGTRYIILNRLRAKFPDLKNISNISQHEISITKGIYSNIDIWGNFSPTHFNHLIYSYGGGVRWMAWEFHVLSFILSLSTRQSNVNNQINISHQTTDLILNYFDSQYFGYITFGLLITKLEFIGGTQGITLSEKTESSHLSIGRPLIGGGYSLGNWLLGFEIGYFSDFIFGIKIAFNPNP